MYNYEKRILRKELTQIYNELENGHQQQEDIIKTLTKIEEKLEKTNQLLENLDTRVCKVGNITEDKIDNTYFQLKDMLIELYKVENKSNTNIMELHKTESKTNIEIMESLADIIEENKKNFADIDALLKMVLVNSVIDDVERTTKEQIR